MGVKMIKQFSTWIVLLFSLASALGRADSPSYPMICQGGPGMYGPVDSIALQGQATAKIMVTFKRGQTARNPLPGECVWLDRAIRPEEPNRFSFIATGSQSLFVTHNGLSTGTGPLKYLMDGLTQRKYFYVHVYQVSVPTFEPFFKVTHLGP